MFVYVLLQGLASKSLGFLCTETSVPEAQFGSGTRVGQKKLEEIRSCMCGSRERGPKNWTNQIAEQHAERGRGREEKGSRERLVEEKETKKEKQNKTKQKKSRNGREEILESLRRWTVEVVTCASFSFLLSALIGGSLERGEGCHRGGRKRTSRTRGGDKLVNVHIFIVDKIG